MIFGSIFNYFTQNNWYKQLENLVLYLFIIFERFLIVRFLLNSWKWWNFVSFWAAEILFTSKLGRIWRGIEWNTLLWPMDEILSQGPRFFGILTWFWNFMLCPRAGPMCTGLYKYTQTLIVTLEPLPETGVLANHSSDFSLVKRTEICY